MWVDGLTLRIIDSTFVKIWPAVPASQYLPSEEKKNPSIMINSL